MQQRLSVNLKKDLIRWQELMGDYIMARNPKEIFDRCVGEADKLIDKCMFEGFSDLAWKIDRKFSEFKVKHLLGEAYRQASKMELDFSVFFVNGNKYHASYSGPDLIGEIEKQIDNKVSRAKKITTEYRFNTEFINNYEEKIYLQFNKTKARMGNGR